MLSIVMAYYDRKRQLLHTLNSIQKSKVKDFEIVIVDDGSKDTERLEDILISFPYIRLIRVEPKDKWYINTCMPMNRGIAEAKGDIIVLQNPECVHVQDVLSYIVENLTEEKYLSISTYAFNESNVSRLDYLLNNFGKLPQQRYLYDLGWYNHPVYRPVYFNFCAALTRSNILKLGGFDERYAMGLARDDVEFVDRITRLGLKKEIPTEVSVIHQWHSKVEHFHEGNYPKRIKLNMNIYRLFTCNETNIYKENSYAQKI